MSAEWRLDKSSRISLHQQIYDFIKSRIMNGEWPVGMRLPTQRELAAKFEVNRSTVVYALGELTADGLIGSRVGQGTFVINNTWSLLASAESPDWNRYVKSGSYQPNIQMIQHINQAEFNLDIVRLGTGELSPEMLPTNQMKEQLFTSSISDQFTLGYSEPKGSFYLREIISAYLAGKGIHASPSSILITSGGLQGLQLISLGLLQAGSTVVVENPSYLNSLHVFQSAGMQLLGMDMDEQGIQAEGIGRLKRQHHAALLYTIPSFHNPTGVLMSRGRREELMKICTQERLPVIEDDVYGELWFDTPPPPPLKAQDHQGLVLYMGSMSKSLGPGLRLGWIVGPEPVIERLSDIKMQTDYGTSSLSQHAVAEWLSSGLYDQHLHHIRTELKARRDYTLALLRQYFWEFAEWNEPQGGFYIWLHISKPISLRQLFEQALKEGILLNPGMIYDRQNQQHLRLSYAYASLEQLKSGLIRLAELIRLTPSQ